MMINDELWKKALGGIETEISRANFLTWFKNTHIIEHSENTITIGVPSNFVKEWLENKYHKYILKSLRNISPDIRVINYTIASENLKIDQKLKIQKESPPPPEEQLEFKDFNLDPNTNLNPRYTLETFIVGPFNELAYAAALEVIKNLGKALNPLFIYGGVGLGKTHLLQAIGNTIHIKDPRKRVYYITSEKFSNEIVSSIQNHNIHNFKEKYRDYDLLIIDDVQFFGGKVKTQEEFFYTFNTLYESGKQVVFSSDRPPKSIPDIEERLRSRLEAGAYIDISEPEYETRLAILKSKTLEKKLDISEKVLEVIASVVQKNIRELEGALNTIHMQSVYHNRILTPDEAKVILSKNTRPKINITPAQIIKNVAEFYDIPERMMFERTRKTEIVKPRQIAMFLIREDLGGSYPFIGQKFNGMDHTTAIHAYEKIINDLKKNSTLEEELRSIREKYQVK
ncbi:chromosomal replication initiator protein DnaA [Candidatus Giovannonibacteria bacterium]|nr:chromosomal replication initiator protein DnaA [Candidatus Giovannonibacteria bacterium]